MRAVGDTSAAPIPGPCADGSLGPLESDAERGMRRGEERLAVTIRSCWSASYISCQSEALEARRLIELRDRWLNPPEWVEWVDAPQRVAPRIVRNLYAKPFASHETAVELVLAVEEDVVPPDRADMGQ